MGYTALINISAREGKERNFEPRFAGLSIEEFLIAYWLSCFVYILLCK